MANCQNARAANSADDTQSRLMAQQQGAAAHWLFATYHNSTNEHNHDVTRTPHYAHSCFFIPYATTARTCIPADRPLYYTKRGHCHPECPRFLFTFMCCVFVLCISFVLYCLYNSLSHDSLSNLHEASNVCTLHVVYIAVSLCAVLHAVLVDILHDRVQTSVNLLLAP